MAKKQTGGTPATVALNRAGVAYTLHPYDRGQASGRPRGASGLMGGSKVERRDQSYGEEAAAALGLDQAQVFKTLMAMVDGRLTVAVVPVSGKLDLKALARAVGGGKAAMAEVAAAERATGYVAGGISPVGQKRAHPTVLDSSALQFPVVYVSAGRRGLDLGIAPADLVAITGAITAEIGRG
ncbi:MAG: aminoacyl-tRNA deacylase [Actinomycetota bacterium]|nr:aminoacyl-tRNA deacylase [Actinomycetota bacterium]